MTLKKKKILITGAQGLFDAQQDRVCKALNQVMSEVCL